MANKNSAIENIINGQLKQGFSELAEAFETDSPDEKLIEELREAFLKPNLEQIHQNFLNNTKLLKEYPYIFTRNYTQPEQNRYILFLLNENLYYYYDKQEKKLFPMQVNSDRETKYFFKDLDKPLFVENEFNEFNLKFIEDNVRDSCDFAGDNHIYLWYENADLFSLLLYYCDLKPLLEHKKFVFLAGEERDKYLIDFKSEFGIDYSSMTPQKIRIDEMKRICYWLKRGYSGVTFVLPVLDRNKYISAPLEVMAFYTGTKYKGIALPFLQKFTSVLNNTNSKYSLDFLLKLIKNPDLEFNSAYKKELYINIIDWLRNYTDKKSFTIPELVRAFMIYSYYKKAPNINPRIVPNIVFEPHWNDCKIWAPVMLTFPYRNALNAIRDQIITCGQIFKHEKSIFIYGDYGILLSVPNDFRDVYSVVKFEDLKMYPEETSRALCEYLCVPFDPQMVEDNNLTCETTCPADDKKPKSMFDKTTLNRNVDSVLSKFDQVRLQIFYDPILRHYGYPTFDFESCPMTDNDVVFLLKFPFKFEKDYIEDGRWGKITPEKLRQSLYSNMVNIWRAARQGQFHFPPVIRPEIDEKKEDET